MIVKICGVTSIDDAIAAVDAGADILGFNFYLGSVRFITVEECISIQKALGIYRTRVRTAGIFVNDPLPKIETTLMECGLDYAQLSGDEPPEFTHRFNSRAIRSIRLRRYEDAISVIQTHSTSPHPRFLIDSYTAHGYGGSGEVADWQTARRIAGLHPIILAGGLDPENVGKAIKEVQPWGVDVASGVESAPGVKDSEKMRSFVKAARGIMDPASQ